jgi:hypothetical protein
MKIRSRSKIRTERPDVAVDQDALCILETPDGNGPGFVFLKPTWVVTAKHVVIRTDGSARPVTAVFGTGNIEAHLRFSHPQVDLAVLELAERGKCNAPLLPGDRHFRDGGLRCVGYQPSATGPSPGDYKWYVSAVPSYKREVWECDGYREVIMDFAAPHDEGGPSGGPVLGYGGAVVAVVTQGYTTGTGPRMRATSIHALLEYLTFPGWAVEEK